MPGSVYALLVGINDYDGLVKPLYGCVKDIEHLHRFLEARVPAGQFHPRKLLDGEATRDAVIDGLRSHLTKAKAGDVAVFCYSGHGSRERTRPEFWFREPDGMNSTLVCFDSRTPGARAWDLADKELGVLIDGVAANDPHVLVVLDSCHSGGGTRGVVEEEAAAVTGQGGQDSIVGAVREVDAIDDERPLDTYVTELQDLTRSHGTRDAGPSSPGSGRHVALFACESFQKAREVQAGETTRGAFSIALESAIARAGPTATYQDLMVSVRTTVTDQVRDQYPLLFTVETDDARLALLGGHCTPATGAFTLVHGAAGWVLDGGACHGLSSTVGAETTVLAVLDPDGVEAAGAAVLTTARVVAVDAASATVELADETALDTARQYQAPIIATPMPPAEVVVTGDERAVAALIQRIATKGPGGGPSPHVRAVARHGNGDGLQLAVTATSAAYSMLRPDGSRLTDDAAGEHAAATVVDRLEHVARWDQIRRLENSRSALAGKVQLWFAAGAPRQAPPTDPEALRAQRIEPDANGVIRLSYAERDPEARPGVFVVVDNEADYDVYVAILDLTDRYKMTANLGGGRIPAGKRLIGWNGTAAPFSIPEQRLAAALASGRPALVRDWIKVIAAEKPFDPFAFNLPPLDGHIDAPAVQRGGSLSTIERIAARALTRDGPDEPTTGAAAEWTTVTIELVTQLPAADPG